MKCPKCGDVLDKFAGYTYDLYNCRGCDYHSRTAEQVAEAWQARAERAEAERDEQRHAKDAAYTERNKLVAFLSRLYPAHLARHPEEDQAWERDWMTIVCIHSPQGQLTWHIHDSERNLFAHLPMGENHWDGHTTAEKYARIARLDPLVALAEITERYNSVSEARLRQYNAMADDILALHQKIAELRRELAREVEG